MRDDAHPDETLRRLAFGLESIRPESSPPAWAEIRDVRADRAGLRWYDGVETMFGYVAPAEIEAVAVVAKGWGRGLDTGPPGSRTILEPGERRRIRIVCVVTRDGQLAGHMRAGSKVLVNDPPGAGRVLDCMLRCFGLPTAPPPVPTDRVLATMWLTKIEQCARGCPGRLSWAGMVALHPAMEALQTAGEHIPLDQLHVALRAAARAWDWDCLLDQARSTDWGGLPAGAAQWMDAGMFARWVLDSWRAPDSLLLEVAPLLAPDVARKLERTLMTLGVTGAAAAAAASQ